MRESVGNSMTYLPRDNDATRFPVSVKGVIIRGGSVILLRNERDEWELPGGKLEPSESPERCLAREIAEELRLDIAPHGILDSWIYTIVPGASVLVLAYGCLESSQEEAVLSDEHKELRWFPLAEIDALRMPEGYKASIRSWSTRVLHSDDSLRACEAALRQAQLAGDVAALDRLVDDALVFTGPDGAVYEKSDDLDAHRNGWVRITRLDPSEERTQRFGSVAVISVRMEMAGIFRGAPFAGPFRYTRVWREQSNGSWRVVAGHVSPVLA